MVAVGGRRDVVMVMMDDLVYDMACIFGFDGIDR
jgi:hypothetical protein